MRNENVTEDEARCAPPLGRALHQPHLWQSDSNLALAGELAPSCEWQACDMRMQQAGLAGEAAAAASAVAIGQQRARATSRAVAR